MVQWVNADLADHATIHATLWDSGLLAPGQAYKVRLDQEGIYPYAGATGADSGVLTVKNGDDGAGDLYLPVVHR